METRLPLLWLHRLLSRMSTRDGQQKHEGASPAARDTPAGRHDPEEWVEVTARRGRFKVLLPSDTRESVMEMPGKPVTYTLSVSKGGLFFQACCKDFSALPRFLAERTMEEERGTTKSLEFQVLRELHKTTGPYPFFESVVRYRSGRVTTRRTMLMADRLYRLEVMHPATETDSETITRFLGSFALLEV